MDIIERAVSVLMHDGLVVYPTETVYGLGADAFSEEAIEKVYEAKKRGLSKPISIAVSDFEMLCAVARMEARMEEFIRTIPSRSGDRGRTGRSMIPEYPDRGHRADRHPDPFA